ncbi:MAG: CE1 family esterase [Planctomycetota bacterium]|jgi:polyhydroxybutyrate depolymerase
MLRARSVISAAVLVIAYPAFADSQIDLGRGDITIHVPASYDPGTPTPLAILLHGYGSSGWATEAFFGFATAAETAGIIYAAPDGTTDLSGTSFWNATDACCNFNNSTVDDSGYLRLLVEAIQAEYNIDDRRIYFAGLSNGGFMSYRMACDHADLIAGIVSVAGATFDNAADCTPTEPVHILQIHGTSDDVIFYAGGYLITVPYPGAVESVETWAQYNGCDLTPVAPPDTLDLDYEGDGAETTITRYPDGCSSGGSAELWTVNGGAHVITPTPDFGPSIAEFMLTHPQPPMPVIPAVSEWGLVVMVLLVLMAGTVVIRRRRRLVGCLPCVEAILDAAYGPISR